MLTSLLSVVLVLELHSNVLVKASWVKSRGRVAEGTFHSVNVAVFEQCLEFCQYTNFCLGVNWSPYLKQCELVDRDIEEDSLRRSFKWTYASPSKKGQRKCQGCNTGKMCALIFNSADLCITNLPGHEVLQSLTSTISDVRTSFTDVFTSAIVETESASATHLLTSDTAIQTFSALSQASVADPSASTVLEEYTSTSQLPETPFALSTYLMELNESSIRDTVSYTQGHVSDMVVELPSAELTAKVEPTAALSVSSHSSLVISSVSTSVNVEQREVTKTTEETSTTSLSSTTSVPTTAVGTSTTTQNTCQPFEYRRQRRKKNPVEALGIPRSLTTCPTFQVPFKETRDGCKSDMIRRDGSRCGCKNGLHFSPCSNTCTRRCTKYGDGFMLQAYLYCIRAHNDKKVSSNDVEECKRQCLKAQGFVCRSFDFWQGTCWLSKDTRADVTTEWTPYCGCIYYQRNCDG